MFHVKQFYNKIFTLRIHEILFYVFLFCLPWQTRVLYNPESAYIGSYFNYHLALFVYLTDLVLITCFVVWLFAQKPKIDLTTKFWLIFGFFTLAWVSVFRVKHLNLGLYEIFKWIECLLLIIYLRETFRETYQFRLTAWIIGLSASIQAGLALWQFHVKHMIGLTWLGEYIPPMGISGLATIDTVSGKIIRAYGTFPHPNVLGAFLVFGLIMALYIGLRIKDVGLRVIVSCGTVLITLGIFVTFSRLAWMATGISYLCFMGHCLWHKDWRKGLILATIAVVSCGTIWFSYSNYLKSRVLESNPNAIADRGFFNDLGLKLVSQHPIFGVGVGNYVPALQTHVKLLDWQYQPAHNIFIFIAAELGVVALAIFLLILFQIFRGAWAAPNSHLKFALILLGIIFLALGQFDHYFVTIQQGRLILFVVLGLLAALPNIQREIINDKL